MFSLSNFPSAQDLCNEKSMQTYKDYLFEREMSSIFELLIWAAEERKHPYIYVSSLSEEGELFLTKLGYTIDKLSDCVRINW